MFPVAGLPEQAHRYEVVGQLTSGILHDIGNSIHCVGMNIQQLQSELANPTTVEPSLQGVLQVQRLLESVRKQLLHQSTITRFSVVKELDLVCSLVDYRCRLAGIKLVKSFQEIQVVGDPVKFSQIFLNLVVNATQALEDKQAGWIRITCKAGRAVKLSVEDNGVGIAQSRLKEIFLPLHTTRENGTGLGLCIVRRLVEEDYHGSISVDSVEGKGTKFTVEIPYSGETSL